MPETKPPTEAQVDRLIGAIGDLQIELAATRTVVEQSVKRSRVAVLLSVVSIALVFLAAGLIASNYQAVRASNQVRDEARIIACVQENVGILRQRVAMAESIVALAPPGTVFTPEQEARIAAYGERVTDLLPFRDCSPDGITAYYQNLPLDPGVGE